MQKMPLSLAHATLGAALLAAAGTLAAQSGLSGSGSPQVTTPTSESSKTEPMSKNDMSDKLKGWPAASREAALFMFDKYGPPAAMADDMALWGETKPWKRTIVYREEVKHDFPMPHTDVMQQWVDYKAPPDKYDELAKYDGSVVLERTAGEISARCDKEGANFLALNLADEIVTGKQTVEQARKMYGEQITLMKAEQPAPYTEKLRFAVRTKTEDPDQALSIKTGSNQ